MRKAIWSGWPKLLRPRTVCGRRAPSGRRGAHMQSGDPLKVVTLLNFAAGKEPSFYGLISERILGIDTQTGSRTPSSMKAISAI